MAKRFQYLTRDRKWLDVPEQALYDNGNKLYDTFTNIYQIREVNICDDCDQPLHICDCDNDNNYEETECGYCGAIGNQEHALKCPDNNSPFVFLINNGYD